MARGGLITLLVPVSVFACLSEVPRFSHTRLYSTRDVPGPHEADERTSGDEEQGDTLGRPQPGSSTIPPRLHDNVVRNYGPAGREPPG